MWFLMTFCILWATDFQFTHFCLPIVFQFLKILVLFQAITMKECFNIIYFCSLHPVYILPTVSSTSKVKIILSIIPS